MNLHPVQGVHFFAPNQETLIRVLSAIPNIRAYSQLHYNDGRIDVLIVPGIGINLPFPGTQTREDVARVVGKLRELGINYIIKSMTLVDLLVATGEWRILIPVFEHNKMPVPKWYTDESEKIILDIPYLEAYRIFSTMLDDDN